MSQSCEVDPVAMVIFILVAESMFMCSVSCYIHVVCTSRHLFCFFILEDKAKLNPRISVFSMAQHLWADKPQLFERGELDLSTAILKFVL